MPTKICPSRSWRSTISPPDSEAHLSGHRADRIRRPSPARRRCRRPPHIRDKFIRAGIRSIAVCNYPLTGKIRPSPWADKERLACYVGAICKARGSDELAAAANLVTQGRIAVAGRGRMTYPRAPASTCSASKAVKASNLSYRAIVGIVALHPIPAYLPSLPVKMFQYSAAGIPVIASDFPLWRQIVIEADCGVLVDPLNPSAIAQAVDHFLTHPVEAERMGRNGRRAVEQLYNSSSEFKKSGGL